MDDYIKRAAADHPVMREYYDGDCRTSEAMWRVHLEINRIPAADVVEVEHGEWKEWLPGDCSLIMTGEEMLFECSVCTAKFANQSNYCPRCGAKMDGGTNHDET